MIRTIRSIRTNTPTLISPPLPSKFGRKVSRVRLAMASSQPDSAHNMDKDKDKPQEHNDKTGDVMSHSFGEGYATRSDEEGFGGVYGGNQSLRKPDDDAVHENHPGYDKSQGSEVKEKESGRHQTHAKN
ncbi:hypothetical protein UlMin_039517 [Ulmus minor]